MKTIEGLPQYVLTVHIGYSIRLRARIRLACLFMRVAVWLLGWRFRVEVTQ